MKLVMLIGRGVDSFTYINNRELLAGYLIMQVTWNVWYWDPGLQ